VDTSLRKWIETNSRNRLVSNKIVQDVLEIKINARKFDRSWLPLIH
jgi:hypothetical protein